MRFILLDEGDYFVRIFIAFRSGRTVVVVVPINLSITILVMLRATNFIKNVSQSCFTRFLSDTQILRVELQLERLATVNTVEQGCTLLETDPEERAINIGVTGRVLDAAHIAEPTIQEILDCLRDFFGVEA